jgi:hypothetical protein
MSSSKPVSSGFIASSVVLDICQKLHRGDKHMNSIAPIVRTAGQNVSSARVEEMPAAAQ